MNCLRQRELWPSFVSWKVLQKLGKADETKDVAFEEGVINFNKQYVSRSVGSDSFPPLLNKTMSVCALNTQ